ncbi:PAS domain S-box protein [bacterium]|nr:PAS domain S-box protein [bacterium]
MRKRGLTLIQKVLIAFILILVPIFIAITALFIQQRNELQSELFATLDRVADEREAYLLLYIEMSKVRIQDFSTDNYIVSTLEDITDRKAGGRALSDYIARHKLPLLRTVYRMSVLTAPDGIVLASTLSGFEGRDFSKEEFFLKGREGLSVVEIDRGFGETPELAFSAPIYSRRDGGRLLGVITGFMDLSRLRELFTGEFIMELGALSWNPPPWKTMEIYIVNRDKLMLTESRFIPDAVLRQQVDTLPVRACLEENREVTGIYEDYRGLESVGASMCLPSLGWTIIAEVDTEEVFQPVRSFQWNIVFLIIVVLLFIGALVSYFLMIIMAQVRKLMAGATAVAVGDYTIRVPVRGRDEMGALTEAFNEMAGSIEARTNELRKEREALADSQRIARLGSWEWDIANDAAAWSEETYRIFGLAPSARAPAFRDFIVFVHPADREELERKVMEALRTGMHYTHEHRIIRTDGAERIVHEEAEVEKDESGNPVRMSGTVQDITEHRRAEMALAESELRYRTLIESLQEGIIALDERASIIYVNLRMAEMLGYTVQEMMGLKLFDIMGEAEAERARERLGRRRRGITETFEAEYLKKDGGTLYVAVAAAPLMEGGAYRGSVAGVIDITQRKLAEDALRESEARLRAILEGMGNPVFIQDMEGRMLFVNSAFLAGLEVRPEEVLGKTIFDIFPPEVARELHEDDLKAMEADEPIQFEDEVPLPDGLHYALTTKFTLRDKEGKKYAMCGVVTDITPLKRAEEALRESEERLRAILENMGNPVYMRDMDGKLIFVNKVLLKLLGAKRKEDVYGKTIFEEMPGEVAEELHRTDLVAMAADMPVTFEETVPFADGLHYQIVTKFTLKNASGSKYALCGVITDITPLKRAEEAVRESESRLRAILENMGNPMFMQDMEGRLIYVNNIFLSNLGAEEKEVYGKTVFDIFPPEVAEELHKDDLKAIESDVPIQVENEIPLPDGLHYALATKFALRDREGKKYALCAVVTDITPLKRAEEALRRSESSLREAQHIAHLGNFEHDVTTDMLYISDEVYRIFGRRKGELENLMDFTSAVHPDDLEMVREAMRGLLYEGRPYSVDYRILRPGGEERIVHSEAECILDKEGRPVRMTGIILDITERKRAEEEVRKLNIELEKRVEERTAELKRAMEGLSAANREIETFTYSVAHDLRSPLRLVDGFSMLLVKKQREKLDKDAQDQIMRIREAVKRMGELIDDLLNLSYVMRAEITYESVDVSALARSIAGNLVKAEPERVASFHIEEGLKARGDGKLLKLVLENLLGNAWKFTSKIPSPRIELGVTGHEDGRMIFHVKDNGAGFDMKHADRLFHPFQRLHPSDEFPGTGIGLATVQRIIQRHGGRVWAEGEPGRGAAFYFTLQKGDG